MYSRYETDTLQELGNIGVGMGITAVSNIIKCEIHTEMPMAFELSYPAVWDIIGDTDEKTYGVLVPFTGDIRGMVLILVNEGLAGRIMGSVLDGDSVNKDGYIIEDIMGEVVNIVVSNYLIAISEYTDIHMNVLAPRVSVDMKGALISEPVGCLLFTDKSSVCMYDAFKVAGDEAKNHILLFLEPGGEKIIMEALKKKEEEDQ